MGSMEKFPQSGPGFQVPSASVHGVKSTPVSSSAHGTWNGVNT